MKHTTYNIMLHEARQRTGKSFRELARESGLAATTIYRLESGEIANPRPAHLQRLAAALAIDVEELYAASGYTAPSSLPELRPYLRAKFGLADAEAGRIEGLVELARRDSALRSGIEHKEEARDDRTAGHTDP